MFGLTEKVMTVIIGVLLVLVAAMWVYFSLVVSGLKSEVKKANEAVGALTVEVATLKVTKANLQKSLTIQTAAVTDLAEKEAESTERAQEALEAERKRTAQWRGRYASILNAPKQGSSCDSLSLKMTRYFEARAEEAGK